eukprot:TRINITY_DN12153_c0_g1_i2.p1 TRINITY_DN12153_c0_g1~~TRINITY_DN12153_c0_g1_i2.p1  ORF type:complete len:362 (-),score=126.85 TRINITY_DN12153_c0_g1_i2:150-1235(-)
MARLCSVGLSLAAFGGGIQESLAQPGREKYTFFCEYQCKDKKSDACYVDQDACKPPEADCTLTGTQPFYSEKVCSQYAASNPKCHGDTRDCDEAADFQLVVDRLEDLRRVYSGQDFHGVSTLYSAEAMVFAPGGSKFFGKEDTSSSYQKLHDQAADLDWVTKQVLTIGGGVHSMGTWAPKNATADATPQPFYARWQPKVNSSNIWQIESMIMSGLPEPSSYTAADDDLFKAIQGRMANYVDLYNKGDYAGLGKDMYTPTAVITPIVGEMVSNANGDALKWLETSPFGKAGAKLDTDIVKMATDANGKPTGVVHEIGFSDSTSSGYYARWVQNAAKEWIIDSHCFSVFPKVTVNPGGEVFVV